MMDIQQAYEQYFTVVYKYLLSISHDIPVAEELTQETFFKAMQKLDSFREDCDVRVWLCQIGKNAYYDYLRRRKRLSPINEESNQNDVRSDLLSRYVDKETAWRLHQILHHLPEPYKEVFNLRTFGELSFKEIALLFGKSESWARVTYHRACKKIKEEENHENNL